MLSASYFCLILTQLKYSLQIVVETWDMKVKEIPVSRSQFVLCGLAGRQTDMMKLIVIFHSCFVNGLKMGWLGIVAFNSHLVFCVCVFWAS
jgi:hypothetical protein